MPHCVVAIVLAGQITVL